MMNDQEWKEFKDRKFAEIPKDFLQQCLDVLSDFITEDDTEAIRKMYEKDGEHWIGMEHHFWGMSCRNFLRTKGLKDDVLPDGNWDDYYIQVVEAFVGIRPIE